MGSRKTPRRKRVKNSKVELVKTLNTYTAIIKQDGDWWIGWIQEVPGLNCQERTREELLETLKITLGEMLELNKKDARPLS